MPRHLTAFSTAALALLLAALIAPMQPAPLCAQDSNDTTLTPEECELVAESFDMEADWFLMHLDASHPDWEPLLASLREEAAARGLLVEFVADSNDDVLVGDAAARKLAARTRALEREIGVLEDRYDAIEDADPTDELVLRELRTKIAAQSAEHETVYSAYRARERAWADVDMFFGYEVIIQTPLYKRIDVVMDGTPLDDAVANLLVQSGVNFVLPLDPQMRTNSVTCRMRDTTIHGALSSILSVFDYEFDSDAQSSTYRDGTVTRAMQNYASRAAYVDRVTGEMDTITQLIWRCRKNW